MGQARLPPESFESGLFERVRAALGLARSYGQVVNGVSATPLGDHVLATVLGFTP